MLWEAGVVSRSGAGGLARDLVCGQRRRGLEATAGSWSRGSGGRKVLEVFEKSLAGECTPPGHGGSGVEWSGKEPGKEGWGH